MDRGPLHIARVCEIPYGIATIGACRVVLDYLPLVDDEAAKRFCPVKHCMRLK